MGSVAALGACISHSLGILLLALIPGNRLFVAVPLLIAATYYAVRQRIWLASEKAQPWRQSLKIVILSLAKLLTMCLLVYFSQQSQPHMYSPHSLLSMEMSFLPLTTLITGHHISGLKAIGLLIWGVQLVMSWYKVGTWMLLLAVLWSVLSHCQEYLNNRLGSLDSSRIRFLSWALAGCFGLLLGLFRFPPAVTTSADTLDYPTIIGLYFLGTLFLVVLPEVTTVSMEEESLRVAGGLLGLVACFVMVRFDLAYYAVMSVVTFTMTAALTYESEDSDLPLTRTQSILTHILSHKDSTRLAIFFL